MTENEWKLTWARWYWGAVKISQGNVFTFKTPNIVFKKPHLEHAPFMAIPPQTAHSFSHCTLISTTNNIIAGTGNMSMSVTLNALKMLKKLSLNAKNQYIFQFNLLIIRSSLRTKSLRCYVTRCGHLSNYTEILKCCDWQINPELYVIGCFQKTFFFLQTQFQSMYLHLHKSEDDAGSMFYLLQHRVDDITSRCLLYNVQWPAQQECLVHSELMAVSAAVPITS